MLKKLDFPLRFLLNPWPYLSKRRRTLKQQSLGPSIFSFGPFDFIFETKQVHNVPKRLRDGHGDSDITTVTSELKLVFSNCFPLQILLNPYMSCCTYVWSEEYAFCWAARKFI